MTSRNYLLLTPGPLTTSRTVKEAMLFDSCTWDDDYNLGVVQTIRQQLVRLATPGRRLHLGSAAGQRQLRGRSGTRERNRPAGQSADHQQRGLRGADD